MVVSSCQIIGYLIGVIGLIATILATTITDWKHNTYSEESFGGIVVKKGLWSKCTVFPSGAIECKPTPEAFFDLPSVMKGCRVIAILSILFGFCGVIVTPLGLHCTRIGGDKLTKIRLARCGAVLFGFSGILIGAAASWFADDVANSAALTKRPQSLRDHKYVYGDSIFIGWGGMVTGILSSLCIGIGSYSVSTKRRKGNSTASTNSESRALTIEDCVVEGSNAVIEANQYTHNKHYGTNSSDQPPVKNTIYYNNNPSRASKHYSNQMHSGLGYTSTVLAAKSHQTRHDSTRNGRANTIAAVRGHDTPHEYKTYV